MAGISAELSRAYARFLLTRPRTTLAILFALLAFFAYHAKDFGLDASPDSLLLEDDKDLHLLRQLDARYDTRSLLIVTFNAFGDLFTDDTLSHLGRLRDELRSLENVESVLSILDAPLVKSADVPLQEMAGNVPTLESPTVDRQRALEELTESPVYENLIISTNSRTAALLINLEPNESFSALMSARNELLIKKGSGQLDRDGHRQLAKVSAAYQEARTSERARHHQTIKEIRSAIDGYRQYGRLHLGGMLMIADDMITFVKKDLIIFGASVLLFLVFVLTLIFRRVRWVILPLLSCFYASTVVIGMLGLTGWKVTVISSNFVALMLIITISMNIHLAVRYTQLLRDMPEESQLGLVSTTLRKMVWPCLYTALTTIIGFGSLVFSNIKPVRDFGSMMSIGLAVAFLTSFLLFPAILVLMKKPKPEDPSREEVPLTVGLAGLTERYGTAILVSAGLLAVLSAVGISRLTVENSFIDYFRENTEIYRGTKLIDDQLGGTTPLQILLDFDTDPAAPETDQGAAFDDEDYLDEWELDVATDPAYWFTSFKIDRIKAVHDYLDSQPEVGKVLSLASIIRVAEDLNDGNEFDGQELSLLYKKLPDEVKGPLLDPYFSFEHNEARIVLRILDSTEGLRRKALLERIRFDLQNQLELTDREFKLTGTLVLYNNMLQSLYASQISSVGMVMVGIGLMFLVLFRSVSLAIIGIVPNLLAAGIVLGLMGLIGIPLDVMTITIAAVAIGIAVDNGIHYIYRFREEFRESGNYTETLHICHTSTGRAIFYTSTTIIFGFSILMLSNFLPTIYFGVLTGLAMLIALLAALTLLPRLQARGAAEKSTAAPRALVGQRANQSAQSPARYRAPPRLRTASSISTARLRTYWEG
jgi:predicted RND superfamily exporter protein